MKLFKKKIKVPNLGLNLNMGDSWRLGINRKKIVKYFIICGILLIFGLLAAFEVINLDFVREILKMFIEASNKV